MDSKVVEGRAVIAETIVSLQKIYRQKPDPFMQLLKVIMDAKADEFVNIFSESFTEEKTRVVTILQEIDPSNKSKYDKILSSN
jgi:Cdc6-like AAA superfamily ATPase